MSIMEITAIKTIVDTLDITVVEFITDIRKVLFCALAITLLTYKKHQVHKSVNFGSVYSISPPTKPLNIAY